MDERDLLGDIREFRAKHNLTQQELAKFLGVSQKTISRWERGADQPGPDVRKRLAQLLTAGQGDPLPSVFAAIRNYPLPLALIDGQGSVLVASDSFMINRPQSIRPTSPDAPSAMPTVMVIEDDDAVLKATRVVLGRWQFFTIGAENGEKAVSLVQEGKAVPDAAIIDFLLPGSMDGVDVADALCKTLPALKVLIISGEATPERMRKISRSGYSFVAKPVDTEQIRMALLSLFPDRSKDL